MFRHSGCHYSIDKSYKFILNQVIFCLSKLADINGYILCFFAALKLCSSVSVKISTFTPHFELTDMIAEFSLLLLFFNLLCVILSGSSSSTNLYAGSTIHAAVLGNRIESTISTRHFCFSALVISGWTDFELGFFKVWYPFTLCCVNTLTLHKSLPLV